MQTIPTKGSGKSASEVTVSKAKSAGLGPGGMKRLGPTSQPATAKAGISGSGPGKGGIPKSGPHSVAKTIPAQTLKGDKGGKGGKSTPKAKALHKKGPGGMNPKQIAVPKSGSMTSKSAPPKPLARGCPCGSLTAKTYFVLFSTGQSYCSECWQKLEKPLGFVQSLEQMKRLGAVLYTNWHSASDKSMGTPIPKQKAIDNNSNTNSNNNNNNNNNKGGRKGVKGKGKGKWNSW